MVGSMRGLKLAYYYYASQSTSKVEDQILGNTGKRCMDAKASDGLVDLSKEKQVSLRFRDSYGIYPCFYRFWINKNLPCQEPKNIQNGCLTQLRISAHVPDGHFYDFEPNIYTFAAPGHVTIDRDEDAYWSTRCRNGSPCGAAGDKVQWTQSPGMPKACINLQKYFDQLEKFQPGGYKAPPVLSKKGPQTGDTQGGVYPNMIELNDDGSRDGTGKKDSPKGDPINVAVQWRFFRSCPKEIVYEPCQDKYFYIKIFDTNTAMCCRPCTKEDGSDCPAGGTPEKLL
jgi:hypothetical protein